MIIGLNSYKSIVKPIKINMPILKDAPVSNKDSLEVNNNETIYTKVKQDDFKIIMNNYLFSSNRKEYKEVIPVKPVTPLLPPLLPLPPLLVPRLKGVLIIGDIKKAYLEDVLTRKILSYQVKDVISNYYTIYEISANMVKFKDKNNKEVEIRITTVEKVNDLSKM